MRRSGQLISNIRRTLSIQTKWKATFVVSLRNSHPLYLVRSVYLTYLVNEGYE